MPAEIRTELPEPTGDAVATLLSTVEVRLGLLALAGVALAALVTCRFT